MSSTNQPTISAVRVAQVVGLTSSAFLTGNIATYSLALIPVLMRAPSTATKADQWAAAYWVGRSTAPPMAVISGLSLAYLAYQALRTPSTVVTGIRVYAAPSPALQTAGYLYLAAAVLVTGFVPFTLTVMKPVNNRLHALANKAAGGGADNRKSGAAAATATSAAAATTFTAQEEQETDSLLAKWRVLNYARAGFPAVAAILSAWAALAY